MLLIALTAWVQKIGFSSHSLCPQSACPMSSTTFPDFNNNTFTDVADLQVVPEWVGWLLICGVGFLFAGMMALVTKVSQRYRKRDENHSQGAADFNTASHSIKPGLIAAGIVSAWVRSFVFEFSQNRLL
jgi:hypothetical protein